jgi:hypothetical protein
MAYKNLTVIPCHPSVLMESDKKIYSIITEPNAITNVYWGNVPNFFVHNFGAYAMNGFTKEVYPEYTETELFLSVLQEFNTWMQRPDLLKFALFLEEWLVPPFLKEIRVRNDDPKINLYIPGSKLHSEIAHKKRNILLVRTKDAESLYIGVNPNELS